MHILLIPLLLTSYCYTMDTNKESQNQLYLSLLTSDYISCKPIIPDQSTHKTGTIKKYVASANGLIVAKLINTGEKIILEIELPHATATFDPLLNEEYETITCSDDGQFALGITKEKTAFLWDYVRPSSTRTIAEKVLSVALSPKGDYYYLMTTPNSIEKHITTSGLTEARYRLPIPMSEILAAHDDTLTCFSDENKSIVFGSNLLKPELRKAKNFTLKELQIKQDALVKIISNSDCSEALISVQQSVPETESNTILFGPWHFFTNSGSYQTMSTTISQKKDSVFPISIKDVTIHTAFSHNKSMWAIYIYNSWDKFHNLHILTTDEKKKIIP